jgi:hypothetical protein
MLPPATAGSLKAFVQLARSQAARKTLLKKQKVANLLRRERKGCAEKCLPNNKSKTAKGAKDSQRTAKDDRS